MRITSINTQISIDNNHVVSKIIKNKCKLNLGLNVYIGEEDFDRHISLNIDDTEVNGFDIWLDIDIYQAELLGKKILELVENRKQFLNK